MIENWNRFKGWSTLEYFLLYPNSKIHINELSRKLKIAVRAAQMYCAIYYNEYLLQKAEIGNIHQYYLNENDARAKALKQFIGPYLVADETYLKPFLEKNKNILSVSIYGSFASGEYGDKSDLDILIIIANERKPKTEDLAKIELRLGREANVTTINFAKWRLMERNKDKFFLNIKRNNILIWGNPI